jgi:hypothetical protein
MQELRGGEPNARSAAGNESSFSFKHGVVLGVKYCVICRERNLASGNFQLHDSFVVAGVTLAVVLRYAERQRHHLSRKDVVVGVDQRDCHLVRASG